ncbi:MAG: hypothetical protein RSE41_08925 [Clostridia bacterium]
MKRYKYLYEIEYINAREGETRFYRGSRISDILPTEDLLIKYRTSSKIIYSIIKEEDTSAFKINDIKILNNSCNILFEEHKYLEEVDAKNNKYYFNQHNNDNFKNFKSGIRVCPHCLHKNYGNLFELCNNCSQVMILYKCKKCREKIKAPLERCSNCNYSHVDDITYKCKKCGNILSNTFEKCNNLELAI